MVSFTIDSTIDGAIHIFGPNRSIFTRIFWICLLTLSISGLFYYIRSAYKKWLLEPDIITRSRMRHGDNFPLFAITLCPQVFDSDSFNIVELNQKVQNKENISEDECNTVRAYLKFCESLNWVQSEYFESEYPFYILDFMDLPEWGVNCTNTTAHHHDPSNWSSIASILLQSLEKFLISAMDLDKVLYNTSYRNVLTSYGACLTFNMLSTSIFKEKWMDEAQGLMRDGEVESNWTGDSKIFSIKPKEIYKSLQVESSKMKYCHYDFTSDPKLVPSFNVIIHQPDQIATFRHESVVIKVGEAVDLHVRIKSERSNENLRTLHPDVRKCYFEDEGNLKYFKRYSKQYCELECSASRGNCQPLELPKHETSTLDICYAGWMHISFYDRNFDDYEGCRCYPSCNHLDYKLEKKPSEISSSPNETVVLCYDNMGPTGEFVEETEKFRTYTVINFVADIGGYLGLFLGVSLLSIVEIFLFISCKIYNFGRKLAKNQQQDEIQPKSLPEEIKSIKTQLRKLQEESTLREQQLQKFKDEIVQIIQSEFAKLRTDQLKECSCRKSSKMDQNCSSSLHHQNKTFSVTKRPNRELQEMSVEDIE